MQVRFEGTERRPDGGLDSGQDGNDGMSNIGNAISSSGKALGDADLAQMSSEVSADLDDGGAHNSGYQCIESTQGT